MALKGMRGRFGKLSRSLAVGAGLATGRFPIAVVLIIAIAVLSNLAAQDTYIPNEADFAWLVAALYGAAASAVLGRVAGEARRWSTALLLAVPAILAAVVGLLIWSGPSLSVFAPALIVAATFAIPLAPYVGRPDAGRFWTFTLWTFVGVTLAFFSVLLFTLGLSAILEMIRFLFEVGLSDDAYEHIFVTAFTLVGPLFALGRIPRDLDDDAPFGGDDRLVAGVRILFDWVAAPLALLTGAILHLYAAKIALSFELPKNEVGWIVTFFALLVLSIRVACDPFIAGGAVPTRLFARVWAVMLVVPLGLLTVAVTLRIGGEGVTLQRYYLALGGLAAGLVVLVQAFNRYRDDIRLIAGLPILLLALSAVGPWGAPDTVGRSQAARIRNGFATVTQGDEAFLPVDLPDPARQELRSRLLALDDAGQLDRIAPLLPPDLRTRYAQARDRDEGEATDVLTAGLGLTGPDGFQESISFVSGAPGALEAEGFDHVLLERFVAAGDVAGDADQARTAGASLALLESDLQVTRNGESESFALLSAYVAAADERSAVTDPQQIQPLAFDIASASGKLIRVGLREINLVGPDGPILSATLTVLLRDEDWSPAEGSSAGDTSLGGGSDGGNAEPNGAVGEGAR